MRSADIMQPMDNFSCELRSDTRGTQDFTSRIKITHHFLIESTFYWLWMNRPCLSLLLVVTTGISVKSVI